MFETGKMPQWEMALLAVLAVLAVLRSVQETHMIKRKLVPAGYPLSSTQLANKLTNKINKCNTKFKRALFVLIRYSEPLYKVLEIEGSYLPFKRQPLQTHFF